MERMMRRMLAIGLAAGLLLAMAAPALAGGPAQTFTETVKDVTETIPEVNPCTGDEGTVTITYNAVFHVTELASGELHVTGTLTGTFVFVPDDSDLPTFTGRFTSWFGENHNLNEAAATTTFRVRGTGSDGSTINFHAVSHITADTIDFTTVPPTVTGLKVMFDKFGCR
jgi:hypothetical protein